MEFDLRYGKQIISFTIPDNSSILRIKEPAYNITEDSFDDMLNSLLNTRSRKYNNTGIVISDKTRLCDYHLYLPWLLKVLESNGAGPENITFYIAYGTHPQQTDEESLNSYGETYRNYRFIHHDCNDLKLFVNLGTTSRGTPVLVRRDVLDSTLLITFGAISHHYFAGFGGGRKLLFPGLAEKKAIYHNHSLFLNHETRHLDEGCQPGSLSGNPVAEDLGEINRLLPDRISLHGILNSKGKVCRLIAGKDYTDFEKVCRIHDNHFKCTSGLQFDMVLASGGGYPKDINFIQAHKGVHHAASFVKDGGRLIILTECRDGIGNNAFLPVFNEGSWDKMFDKLSRNYSGNGGTALAMKAKTERIKIFMFTSLDEATCRLMGALKTGTEEINNILESETGTLGVIENASMLIR